MIDFCFISFFLRRFPSALVVEKINHYSLLTTHYSLLTKLQ